MRKYILYIIALLFTILFVQPLHAATDFSAEYFNNINLSGTPVFTRTESTINHNWGNGSPDASINTDQFSAKWTGTITTEAADYKFTVTADDGVRLKVDGQTIIDQWKDQAPTTIQKTITLAEGDHAVVLEYYENGGGAMATLVWEKQSANTSTALKIMPLGDSITDGWDIPGGYRVELKNVVSDIDLVGSMQNGPGQLTDREHEGHPGWKIHEIHGQVVGWLNTHNPQMVLLMIGTNDMIGNHDVVNAPQRLSSLIDTITSTVPEAEVLVASITPLSNSEYQQRADSFNQTIPGIIQQKRDAGKKVHYVDMHTAITTADLPDGIHPSAAGYQKMAQKWASAINTVKNGSTPEMPDEPEDPTPTPPLGDGAFTAEYFNNTSLAGIPVLVRNENEVNYDWVAGSPHVSVNNDNFSARWATSQTFDEATYRFTVTADDGVRLKIDGVTVIDQWKDQAPTGYSALVPLSNGQHTVIMEYYEKGYGAVAKLSWEKVQTEPEPTPTEDPTPTPSVDIPIDDGFRVSYFNNTSLSGTPILTRQETKINYDWGAGSPHTSVPTDNFSARWQGDFTFDPGTYTFNVTGDDGVRLKIDDTIIINKWINQGPTTYTSQIDLSGVHRVTFEYYESGGGAVAVANWTKETEEEPTEPEEEPADPDIEVPFSYTKAEYFNNINLTGTPVLTRVESVPNYNWGLGSPDASVNNDNFSARWTYTDNFSEDLYEFKVTADDGVRLKIDGVTVIDKWIDQAATTYTVVIPMTAGGHTIVMEYYEKGWGAIAKLEIKVLESEPQPQTPQDGEFTIQYFNNTSLIGVPVHTAITPTINYDWVSGSPHPTVNNDNFSAKATKTADYEAGTYRFTVTADDGVRLKIDGVTVIDKWIDQAPTSYSYQTSLSEGNHTITVEYYEKGYGAVLKLQEVKL